MAGQNERSGIEAGKTGRAHKRFRPIYLLLLIPVIAALWTPFFNRTDPEIAGVPFFYWYQLMWVPLAAVVLFIVYRADARGGK